MSHSSNVSILNGTRNYGMIEMKTLIMSHTMFSETKRIFLLSIVDLKRYAMTQKFK